MGGITSRLFVTASPTAFFVLQCVRGVVRGGGGAHDYARRKLTSVSVSLSLRRDVLLLYLGIPRYMTWLQAGTRAHYNNTIIWVDE